MKGEKVTYSVVCRIAGSDDDGARVARHRGVAAAHARNGDVSRDQIFDVVRQRVAALLGAVCTGNGHVKN